MHFLPLPKPVGGILAMGSVLVFAWVGGLRAALLMAPLLLLLARLARDAGERWSGMNSQELMGLTVVTLVTATTGLAGEYRRRVRAVTKQHAQKLRDQARALSQAPIVYRSIDGRITEWSEGAERLCGWRFDDIEGQVLHELLDVQFPAPRAALDAELEAAGQWRGEVKFRHRDGSDLHVVMHWILYRDDEGRQLGVAEVWTDVTELRRAEAAVRDGDRRKDEFLAMLAHELRNPLAPIRTGIELMRVVKEDPEQVDSTCDVMERQMGQLVALVDDLLDVSRITRGKFELRKAEIVLRNVVSSAVEAVTPALDAAGHELLVSLPAAPVCLHADPHRLTQVVSNILDNAIKYTPRGGSIRVAVERHGQEATLTVSDNGLGISAEKLDRVFDLFWRSSSDGEATHAGLGIGLGLAKTIVEMHGGQVTAHSEGAGRGTQFVVRLPILATSAGAAVSPPAVDDRPINGRRRVLVVDDNVDAARVMSVLVKKFGNDVRVAHDGLEAIAAAEEFLPDVTLLDLGMPKLDGYGAAQHIRQQPWGREMTLIALTGWGQDADKQRTQAAGFDHHLVKPANPDELRRLIFSAGVPEGSHEPQLTNGNGMPPARPLLAPGDDQPVAGIGG